MDVRIRPTRSILALALGAALAGCSEGELMGPSSESEASLSASSASVVDLSGGWNWSNVEALTFPPDVALMVGIAPEGEVTQARCESAGSMTLVQTGASFEGQATKTSNSCETRGGQAFQQPATVLQITDGRVRGHSAHFSFHSFVVRPCPHQVVISTDQSGTATALSGTGRCVLPGHPQSESPVDLPPPPGGTSKTLSWQAVRP